MGVDTLLPAIDRLTSGQKDCLRLVSLHFSSKEVARELGISPHTVDQRLKRAASILQAGSRFEAARLLSAHEGTGFSRSPLLTTSPYQPSVYQRPDIYVGDDSLKMGASDQGNMPRDDLTEAMLQEMQANYFSPPSPQRKAWSTMSVLFEEKRENDLTTKSRLLVMMLIMVLGLLAFAILVSILEGLSRLY